MPLGELFDKLDKLILDGAPVGEIRGVLNSLRDQVEALELDHAALNSAHSVLYDEKAAVDNELAQMKAAKAKLETDRRETRVSAASAACIKRVIIFDAKLSFHCDSDVLVHGVPFANLDSSGTAAARSDS